MRLAFALLLAATAVAQDKPRLVARLGHIESVSVAVYSPDGRHMLTGDTGGLVILWEAATGREVRRFDAEGATVVSLDFSRDGRRILAGLQWRRASDPKAILWSTKDARVLWKVYPQSVTQGMVGLSPDGEFVALGGREGILDVETRARIFWLKTEEWSPFHLGATYSPDGRMIATVTEDAGVLLWDATNGKLLHRLAGDFEDARLPFVSFSADGSRVLTFLTNEAAILWDATNGKEIRRFAGKSICTIALAPDGSAVAVGTEDGKGGPAMSMWDAKTGLRRWRWPLDRNEYIPSARFAPDGRRLLLAFPEQSAAAEWDAESGEELRRFGSASSRVPRASFLGRGQLVVQTSTPSADTAVHVWDGRLGRVVRRYESTAACRVGLSRDGRCVLENERRLFRIRDVRTGEELHVEEVAESNDGVPLRGRNGRIVARLRPEPRLFGWISDAVISPDGRRMILGDPLGERPAAVFDLTSGKELCRNGIRGSPLAFSADGSRIYVATSRRKSGPRLVVRDAGSLEELSSHPIPARWVGAGYAAAVDEEHPSTIEVRKIATGEMVALLKHDRDVSSFAISPDGSRAVAGLRRGGSSESADVCVWDLAGGKLLHGLEGHTGGVVVVAFSPDGNLLLSADWAGVAHLWDRGTSKRLFTLSRGGGAVRSAAFSRDGRSVALGFARGDVRVWSTKTGAEGASPARQPGEIQRVAFLPDGRLFAYCRIGFSRIWNARGALERTSRFALDDNNAFRAWDVSAHGRLVMTTSSNASPVLWDAATGKELRRFDGHVRDPASVALAPVGRKAASIGLGRVIVWDTATGRRLREWRLKGTEAGVVAFSGDGSRLAAGGSDGIVCVWDVRTGRRERVYEGHVGGVLSLGFSQRDSFLVSGGADGTARIWSLVSSKERCRLINFKDGSWAVVDSEGRFDASDAGDVPGLYWVVGNETIRLNQLKERYYEPGLLSKALALDPTPRRSVKGFGAPKLFPRVKLDPPSGGEATLRIHLKNRGGGIGRVVVRINGKEMLADARGGGTDPEAEALSLDVPLAGDPRLKPGANNVIEVFAYNAEGYLRSRGMRVAYKAAGEAAADRPELWAVVAGVSDYAGDVLDLRYAAKDAADFATAIETAATGLFGVKRVHLAHIKRPTRTNLVAALEAAREAKSRDLLVVYLAGHGVSHGGQDGDFYYLTGEAASADLTDPAVRSGVALSSAELTEMVKSIPALKQVLILDTCASGKFIEKLTEQRNVPTSQIRALERLKERTGLHILAGCAADRVSYEATRYAQGLLTYSLLLGMRGAALKDDEYVDVSRLFQFAADQVPELAGEIGGIQRPVIASPKGGVSFDIGKLDEKSKAQVPLRSVRPLVLRGNFQDEEELDDVLGLGKRVNAQLRAAKVPVFVDATEFPDAYRIVGRYRGKGDTVTVDVRLLKGKKKIARFAVEGSVAELAATIVAEAVRRMK